MFGERRVVGERDAMAGREPRDGGFVQRVDLLGRGLRARATDRSRGRHDELINHLPATLHGGAPVRRRELGVEELFDRCADEQHDHRGQQRGQWVEAHRVRKRRMTQA